MALAEQTDTVVLRLSAKADQCEANTMEEADLQRLIDDGVPEGREIDYKLDLTVGTDEQKKEFLADVSSFANTVGGTLYIGIREENLLPVELVGLSVADQDLEIQRI
jgi:predicted HTH transcriptional regulator